MNKHHHRRRATTFTALLHEQAPLAPDNDVERAARIEALRKWRGLVVAGSEIAFPATAQQQQAAPSEQPSGQMQRDADKGAKTRNSGESGYVANQDKPGASAHPPGQPESEQTTGSSSQTGAPK
jgi:hypothetical protein